MAQEIGRRIAEELSARFAAVDSQICAEKTQTRLSEQAFATLREAISVELRGFNRIAPSGFQLGMLSGQNCLVFSFAGTPTLTLTIDHARVRLVPAACNQVSPVSEEKKGGERRSPSEFDITRDEGQSHYSESSSPSLIHGPGLSELQFIDGVIRVACSQPFERP